MEEDFDLDEYARERDAYISDMEKYTEHLNKFREQKQEQLDKLSAEEETEYRSPAIIDFLISAPL